MKQQHQGAALTGGEIADRNAAYIDCLAPRHRTILLTWSFEPDGFVVPDRVLQLGENVFVSERLAVGIDVGVPAGHVKQRGHLLDVIRNDEGVRLAGRLECVVALGSRPSRARGNAIFRAA